MPYLKIRTGALNKINNLQELIFLFGPVSGPHSSYLTSYETALRVLFLTRFSFITF